MNIEHLALPLKGMIRDVPDFPKKGIVFKDITTLLKDPVCFRRAMDLFSVLCGGRGADKLAAVESRGFILGGLLADRLGIGFVPVRKPGKLRPKPFGRPTSWSTEATPSRSTRMPWRLGRGSSSSTT
jgi:adenine phosphoribosyltransferase